MIGSGQLESLLESRPPNVEWIRWVEYDDLPRELYRAGCALGIFGTSDKARRVIPNKAFQALACGVPLVTADTPAARELLADGESALLVPPGDPEALADALRRLTTKPALRDRLAAGGHAATGNTRARSARSPLARTDREPPVTTHRWGTAPDFVVRATSYGSDCCSICSSSAGPGPEVLNGGAGQGHSRGLAELGFEVTSTDVSPEAVEVLGANTGRRSRGRPDIASLRGRALRRRRARRGAGAHRERQGALAEVARVLRPNGVLGAVGARKPQALRAERCLGRHVRRYTRPELLEACSAAGFIVHRCLGWGFPVSPGSTIGTSMSDTSTGEARRAGAPAPAARRARGALLQLDRLFVGVERGALGYLALATK